MKQDRRTNGRAEPPALRTALAVFAVLLNSVLPGAIALAPANAGPFSGDHVFCFAGGGSGPTPLENGTPAVPGDPGVHCQLCLLRQVTPFQLPQPTAVPLPEPFVTQVRYAPEQASWQPACAATAFDARAPPV